MKTRHLMVPLCAFIALSGCESRTIQPNVVTQFKPVASVQEIMQSMIDPSADAVWDSVGMTLTASGADERMPRTDEEWTQVRRHAIVLAESTNLLMMNGRQMVRVGGKLLDEGAEGVLTAAEAQQKLQVQNIAFVQFAGALHEAAEKMLTAIDQKNPQGMLEVGGEMDGVCEACHQTFWYPNQVLPKKLSTDLSKKLSAAKQ